MKKEKSFNLEDIFSVIFSVYFIVLLIVFNFVAWLVGFIIGCLIFVNNSDSNKITQSSNHDLKYKNERIVFKNVFKGEVFQDKTGLNDFLQWVDEKKYSNIIALAKKSARQFGAIYNNKNLLAKDVLSKSLEFNRLVDEYLAEADIYVIIKRLELSKGEPVQVEYSSFLKKKKVLSKGDVFNLMFFPYGLIICVLIFYIAFYLEMVYFINQKNKCSKEIWININRCPRQVLGLIVWITVFFPVFLALHVLKPIIKFLYKLDLGVLNEWLDARKKERQYDEDVQYGLALLRKAEQRVSDQPQVAEEINKMISFLENMQKIRSQKENEEQVSAAINYAKSLKDLE